jgi:hypothetical protein
MPYFIVFARVRLLPTLLGLFILTGCSGVVDRFANNLSSAMMDNNDRGNG